MSTIIDFNNYKKNIEVYDEPYSEKLKRIRDEIEDDLHRKSLTENDPLAVSLASGRFSAMKLANLIGKEDTINFYKDCIKTIYSLKN